MNKENKLPNYNVDVFFDQIPLITRFQQMKEYIDGKLSGGIDSSEIKETIKDTLNDSLDCKLSKVHRHLDDVEEHICCDICCSKKDIINHVDNKFDIVNQHFSDLNKQVEEINNKV